MKDRIFTYIVVAVLSSVVSVWFYSKFSATRVLTPSHPSPTKPAVSTIARAVRDSPARSAEMTPERILGELARAGWCADDPQRPSQSDGLTDDELAQTKSEVADRFCNDALNYLSAGNGQSIHWLGLGRLLNAFGKSAAAKECFQKAATITPPAAATYFYLAKSDYSPDDEASWRYLETAVKLGYTPAAKQLKELGNTLTQEIDEALADSADPDLPLGVKGVSDAAIQLMKPAEVNQLIKAYGFVVQKSGFPTRLAYELGRAAFLHKMHATASNYLTLAARNGSGAACAHLAGPPYTMEENKQITLLKKAVALKYKPANLRLELLLGNRKALYGDE